MSAGHSQTLDPVGRERERLLGLDRTWPAADVVSELCDAVDHLLQDHDCDGDGHERRGRARREGRRYVELWTTVTEANAPAVATMPQRLANLLTQCGNVVTAVAVVQLQEEPDALAWLRRKLALLEDAITRAYRDTLPAEEILSSTELDEVLTNMAQTEREERMRRIAKLVGTFEWSHERATGFLQGLLSGRSLGSVRQIDAHIDEICDRYFEAKSKVESP